MNYRILVPSGIGDFSWLWSKLVTTPHNFHIEYMGGYPDRLKAFLALLPPDRVLSFSPNVDFCTRWDENNELVCYRRDGNKSANVQKAGYLSSLSEDRLTFIENNSFLEAGNRIEGWWKDEIPGVDYHYALGGYLARSRPANYYIVNFSSYGTKKAWGYYEVDVAADIVRHISAVTGHIPLFIGGEYDDFTKDIYERLAVSGDKCLSLIGRTQSLIDIIPILQQSRFYFGACSGLMVLTNILRRPVITYYPPFPKPPGRHLSGAWHDPKYPHLGLFWDGDEIDKELIEHFLTYGVEYD